MLLAGLVVIGLLCGERAQAADGGAAGAGATDLVRSVARDVPDASDAPDAAEPDVVEPVAKSAARPAVERVVRPVRDVVDGAAQAVDDVRSGTLPDARRVLPEPGRVLPEPGRVLPEPQELLPEPSRPPEPGDDGAVGTTQPAPPAAGDGKEAENGKGGKGDRDGRGGRGAEEGSRGDRAAFGPGLDSSYTYGGSASGGVRGDAAFAEDGAGGQGQVPLPGRPGGCVSGQSAGDGSSQRHADQCAVGSGSRGEVRLVAGASASDGADPIRERHRDILEFPG